MWCPRAGGQGRLHGCPAAWYIETDKLRGVESNGMLCSLAELGLTAARSAPTPTAGRHLCIQTERRHAVLGEPMTRAAIGLDDTGVRV